MSTQESIKREFFNTDNESLSEYDITEIEIKTSYSHELDNDTSAFLSLSIDDLN